MFNNEIFDSWLNKKSDEILSKVDRERISTEEMIILVLKAQTNHFHHMDEDMKKGLHEVNAKIDRKFEATDGKFEAIDQRFESIDQRFESINRKFEAIDRKFEAIDRKFEGVDQKFEKMEHKIDNRFMWTIGIMIAMSGGIYLKLFLG
ncbi:MAG: hypothetical protein HOP07_11295 [Bacteriovoracaceae bacterium]|nr:hypothetical protein [Bacteriovoracaceae bacterium]